MSTAYNVTKNVCAVIGAAAVVFSTALVSWAAMQDARRRRYERQMEARLHPSRLVPEPHRRESL